MKFAFCTCVQIGLSCIESIYRVNGNIDLLITLKDEKAQKKSGRIYLDKLSKEKNIPLIKINHINDEEVKFALIENNIDWLFIIGWSQIASKEIINTPTKGTIGAHPSLLPVGRGRAAIPWAIIKGLKETGVSLFKMDEGVDTGPILGQEVIPLDFDETATSLYRKVNKAHETLLERFFPKLNNNEIKAFEQDEAKATYWPRRKPEDGELFYNMTVSQVDRLVRATTKPYPGAFIITDNKEKLIIWSGEKGVIPKASFVLNFIDGKYSVLQFDRISIE